MLVTLSAKSLLSRLRSTVDPMELSDMPRVAAEEMGMRGLCVQTDLLSGVGLAQIDRLRDQADKAGCPCLLLVEEQPHPLGEVGTPKGEEALERLNKVLRVAHRLGCSSVAIGVKDTRGTGDEGDVATGVKRVVAAAERLELNVLIAPQVGVTETPEALINLIRKVGGFRIGSYPDFEVAKQTSDPTAYLRAITPYASAINVPTPSLDGRTKDPTYDLNESLTVIRGVGYDATLALECRGGDPAEPVNKVREQIEGILAAEAS